MKEPDNKRPLSYVLFKKFGIRGACRILIDDVGFDVSHRVNTAAPMSQKRLFGAGFTQQQHRYVASTFHVMNAVLGYASSHYDLRSCGFVDLGSGKAKALIAANDYPFCSLTGIEYSGRINAIARRNVKRLNLEQRITLIEGSAEEYQFRPHECIVYFFNSFSGDVLDKVLQNLITSPRLEPGLFIYVNPTQRHQVEAYLPCLHSELINPGECEVSYYALPKT